MRDCANVIFMAMRQQKCMQAALLGLDKARIRRNQFNPRLGVAAECYPQINHNPVAPIARPIAIQVTVHANLAGASQRNKNQIIFVLCHSSTD